ncbi:MAG: Holliday junction resolvase RuvX [Pseudomonadota bacterium]
MPILPDLDAFAAARDPARPVFGLDHGTKTIGIAVCDPALSVASPLTTIRRRKFTADLEALKTLMDERAVGGLVLGLPLNMDGSAGPRAQSVKAFARNLDAHIDVPIAFWDERLSTQAVTRTLLDADASRKRRAEIVDKMAAAYILQGAIDYVRSRV